MKYKRKIVFYEAKERMKNGGRLIATSLDDFIKVWRDTHNAEYPCEIDVLGCADLNKKDYVPTGKAILNTIFNKLYAKGYIDDFSYGDYDSNLIEKADELSNEIIENTPPCYKDVVEYKIKLTTTKYKILSEKEIQNEE
jgi:hypothetical protein